MDSNTLTGAGVLALLVIFVPYFFPFIVAALRGHHNMGGVFIVNLLLGWTLIGWIIAFVMACTSVRRRVVTVRQDRRDPLDVMIDPYGKPARRALQEPTAFDRYLPLLAVVLLVFVAWAIAQTAKADGLHEVEQVRGRAPFVATEIDEVRGRAPVVPTRQPPMEVEHNGSLMIATVLPDGDLEIVYARPRPGLWGVVPGTVLVRGRWIKGPSGEPIMAAISHSFPPGCPPFPYKVTGTTPDAGTLVLTGPAPVIDPYGCVFVEWIWSQNSTLVFKFLGPVR